MNAELLALVNSHRWHHSIDLGDGIITAGGKSLFACQSEANLIFDRISLGGLSVLDIGAWNGFFSFEAKKRGAARVLATDSYCWNHPHIRGRETFEIAKSVLNLDVETRTVDVSDMSTASIGQFDVVLYLGVFYHRYDAVEALARVAPLAKEVLVVETHLELRELDTPAMAFFPGRELADDPTNWWGPNEACVTKLLQGHGFSEIEVAAHPAGPNRAIFHAWRSTAVRQRSLPAEEKLKTLAEYKWIDFISRHPLVKLSPSVFRPLYRKFWS